MVSPAMHVDAVKIPILLIHGDKDESVPVEQSESHAETAAEGGPEERVHQAQE